MELNANESEPIYVEFLDNPIARGLPLLAPASKLKPLNKIAIANAPSKLLKVFFIAFLGLLFSNDNSINELLLHHLFGIGILKPFFLVLSSIFE